MNNSSPPPPDHSGQQSATTPPPTALHTRMAAVEILLSVLHQNKLLDFALAESVSFAQLDSRDKRLARMIVSTTLRHLGQINALLDQALNQDAPLRPARLQALLQASVTQIVFLDTPAYAAVDTAVSLAHTLDLKKQKGLINAVLRRISREGTALLAQQDAAVLNIPAWLFALWEQDYGPETAREIAQASLTEAPLDITAKNEEEAENWALLLNGTHLPTHSIRVQDSGFVPDMPGFQSGAWWVQDAAAAIPARLFGNVQGKRVFDLCAAPGGKTAQLAAAGAHVTAIDRSAKRLAVLKENMERLKLEKQVHVVTADAAGWTPEEKADAVLVDAPCSATGTVRRHPDLLYLKTARDIAQLKDVQDRILHHAATLLKPGGILVYCTCSLQKAEGEERIAAFLKHHPDMRRKPVQAAEVGGVSQLITQDGDVRCLPFHLAAHGGLDGFYAARLTKDA